MKKGTTSPLWAAGFIPFPYVNGWLYSRLFGCCLLFLVFCVVVYVCVCFCFLLFFFVFVLCLEPNANYVSRFSILGCVLCLEPNTDCVSRFSILGCPLRFSLTYSICMLLLWKRSTIYRNYCIKCVSVKEITNFYISYSLNLIPLQHT